MDSASFVVLDLADERLTAVDEFDDGQAAFYAAIDANDFHELRLWAVASSAAQ